MLKTRNFEWKFLWVFGFFLSQIFVKFLQARSYFNDEKFTTIKNVLQGALTQAAIDATLKDLTDNLDRFIFNQIQGPMDNELLGENLVTIERSLSRIR